MVSNEISYNKTAIYLWARITFKYNMPKYTPSQQIFDEPLNSHIIFTHLLITIPLK